jgi:ABC-type glycerol-3-phosphate transport system substrate-binding protein
MSHVRRLALLFALALVIVPAAMAQDGGEIVISLAVPSFFEEVFSEELLAQFEAENPGVKVNLVTSDGPMGGSPAYGVEDYLDTMEEYVSSADVVYVSNNNMAPEATRAGYFLDLTPLTSADTTLNVDDFIPAAWQSFQWDRGIWALPVAVDVILLIYNPEAFDNAGIPYPNAAWSLDDFANAVRALTTTDADGEQQAAYTDYGNTEYLFRSLLGAPVYDPSTSPIQPDFSNPTLETLITTWQSLLDEGVVQGLGGGSQIVIIGAGAEGPAISIQQSFGLATFPNQETTLAGSLLPGGKAGLEAQGFAISAGTQYPEQAYSLLKFLTNSIDVADGLFQGTPARYSLMGMESSNQEGGPGGGPGLRNLQFTPENQAVIDEAFANAIPVSDMLFGDYISVAIENARANGSDIATALADAELTAVNNLTTAQQRGTDTTIAVATPVPEVVLNPGEVSLNFGMTSFIQPLPNQDQWDAIIEEFVANDPEVGQVVLDVPFETDLAAMAQEYDCFYLPTNAVQDSDDLSPILPLDPYLDADPTFDRSDILGNTLQQVQYDNMTWAYPMVIMPELLRYNSEMFQQAGIPLPENGWTIDAFVDALESLKAVAAEDTYPFVPQDFGSNYLLSLIAAYGGLPIDYNTSPVTINFTDPATVDAIRQALDLAKAGYIKYDALAIGLGGQRAIFAIGGEEETDAIQTYSLAAAFGLRMVREEDTVTGQDVDPYRLVAYPQGSSYVPMSYNVGTGYISASSENPEACYRWLSTVAQHPELFNAMPARRSFIDSPAVTTNTDPALLAVFNQVADLLAQPNVINLPTGFRGTPETAFLQTWLNRAFDRYVLEDADLQLELEQAQANAQAYQECAAAIPPYDESSGQAMPDYFNQFMDCATSVDPTLFS